MRTAIRGFTLLELVLTVAIMAICAVVAVPALAPMLERYRANATLHALATRIQLTRMAAITYRQPAILCPSADGAICGGTPDWSGGWILFLDPNGNRIRDPGERLVRTDNAPVSRHLRVLGTTGRPQLRYLPDGRSAGSNVTLSVCGRDDLVLGAVIVSNGGRPRRFRPVAPFPCPG